MQPIWIAIAKRIDPLGNTVLAQHLRAEQASVGFPEEDLDREHLGARIVTRVRIRDRGRSSRNPGPRAASSTFSLAPVWAIAALEDLTDRGALRPAVTGVAPGNHIGRDPALPVRRPGQRDERPLAGDEVLDLDRVADGEDVGVAGAHLLIDADSSTLAELDSGHLCQRRLRTHADRQDHDVRRMALAGTREDFQRTVRGLLESGHAVIEFESDAVLDQ